MNKNLTRLITISVVSLIALSALVLCGCSSDDSDSDSSSSHAPSGSGAIFEPTEYPTEWPDTDIAILVQDYANNTEAANAKYKNKGVTVTGIVMLAQQGELRIVLSTDGNKGDVVVYSEASAYKEQLHFEDIDPGDTLEIKGTVVGIGADGADAGLVQIMYSTPLVLTDKAQ